MKNTLFLVLFVFGKVALAGIGLEPVLITNAGLRAKGFEVSKTLHRSAVTSATVVVAGKPTDGDESFQALEFVVYADEISLSSVRDVDSGGYQKVVRRDRTSQPSASFEAFGNEITHAYLVFEFFVHDKAPMSHYRRYLLPISAIDEKKG